MWRTVPFPDGAVRNHNSAGLDHTRYSEARIGDYICAPHDDGLGHSLAHPCNQLARGREPGRASSARTDLFEVLRKKSPGTVRRSWPLREGPRPAFSAGKSRVPRSRSAGLFAYSPGIHYQDPLTPAWSFYPLAREGYLASSDSSFASSRPAANWCSGRRGILRPRLRRAAGGDTGGQPRWAVARLRFLALYVGDHRGHVPLICGIALCLNFGSEFAAPCSVSRSRQRLPRLIHAERAETAGAQLRISDRPALFSHPVGTETAVGLDEVPACSAARMPLIETGRSPGTNGAGN